MEHTSCSWLLVPLAFEEPEPAIQASVQLWKGQQGGCRIAVRGTSEREAVKMASVMVNMCSRRKPDMRATVPKVSRGSRKEKTDAIEENASHKKEIETVLNYSLRLMPPFRMPESENF